MTDCSRPTVESPASAGFFFAPKGDNLPPMRKKSKGDGRGNPVYTKSLADRICDRLAAGETLRSVCRSSGMPTEAAVRKWAMEKDDFSAQYARARDIGYMRMADEILEISDSGENDWMAVNDPENPGYRANGEHINRSRLRVDTRKWLLSKALPKIYGDRVDVTQNHTLSGSDGSPLELARGLAFVLALAQREATDAADAAPPQATKH